MKTVISAALLSVLTASASAAADGTGITAQPDHLTIGEGGNGSESVKLASTLMSPFLVVPDAGQSLLVTVGEGGEGGEGRRGRKFRRHPGHYFGHYRSPRYRYDRDYSPYYIPRGYDRPYYDQDYYRRRSPYF